MTKVLFMMYRMIMADAMKQSLSGQFQMFVSKEYKNIVAAVLTFTPDITLVEIPESDAMHPEKYLQMCVEVRKEAPNCKLLLMCPEHNSESIKAVVDAMRSGKIDDYVFYDASMEYLKSKLEVLSADHSN